MVANRSYVKVHFLRRTSSWAENCAKLSFQVVQADWKVVQMEVISKVVKQKPVLVLASAAAVAAGCTMLRYFLLKSVARVGNYSRTAELACLCRYATLEYIDTTYISNIRVLTS